MNTKDLVFECRKCGHSLFLTNGVELKGSQIAKKLIRDCPECGEEGYENWIYERRGNYETEYEN